MSLAGLQANQSLHICLQKVGCQRNTDCMSACTTSFAILLMYSYCSPVSPGNNDSFFSSLCHNLQLTLKRSVVKCRWSVYFHRCLYFSLFYAVLFAFFWSYLNLTMYFHIQRNYPSLTGLQSALQANPGLSIVPVPDVYNSLIYTSSASYQQYEVHVGQLLGFMSKYEHWSRKTIGERSELAHCVNQPYRFDPLRPCIVDLNMIGPCCIDNAFGYDSDSPCVLLKMNKIYGWLPDPVPFSSGVIVKCEGMTDDDTYNLGETRLVSFVPSIKIHMRMLKVTKLEPHWMGF